MNQMRDQYLLVAAERFTHEKACNRVRDCIGEEYGPVKSYAPKNTGWLLRSICRLLTYLSQLMSKGSERLESYSLAGEEQRA